VHPGGLAKFSSLDKPKHLASQNFCADRTCSQFKGTRPRAYWKIIGDNLSKAGWSWGCSRLFEIAHALVRLDHVASFIVNTNHGAM